MTFAACVCGVFTGPALKSSTGLSKRCLMFNPPSGLCYSLLFEWVTAVYGSVSLWWVCAVVWHRASPECPWVGELGQQSWTWSWQDSVRDCKSRMALLYLYEPIPFKTLCSVTVLSLPPKELAPSSEMVQHSDRVPQGLQEWFKWWWGGVATGVLVERVNGRKELETTSAPNGLSFVRAISPAALPCSGLARRAQMCCAFAAGSLWDLTSPSCFLSRGSHLWLAWQSTFPSLPPPGLQAHSPLTLLPSAHWSLWIWGSRSNKHHQSSHRPPWSWGRMKKSPPLQTLMSPTQTWLQLSSSAWSRPPAHGAGASKWCATHILSELPLLPPHLWLPPALSSPHPALLGASQVRNNFYYTFNDLLCSLLVFKQNLCCFSVWSK